MKAINNYINESKNFKLTESERDTLSDFIGVICGNLGDDEDQNELKDVINELDNDEISQLKYLHDLLDNNQTYKSINRNMIIDDIDSYEQYCASHPNFKNNKAGTNIAIVKNTYKKCKSGELKFLEYNK